MQFQLIFALERHKLISLVSWQPISYTGSPPAGELVWAATLQAAITCESFPGHLPTTRTGVYDRLPSPSRQTPELCLRLGLPIRYSLPGQPLCTPRRWQRRYVYWKWVNIRNPKVNYHVHVNPPSLLVDPAQSPINLLYGVFEVHFNIISLSTPKSFKWYFFSSNLHPAPPISFDRPANSLCVLLIMKLLSVRSCRAFMCYFVPQVGSTKGKRVQPSKSTTLLHSWQEVSKCVNVSLDARAAVWHDNRLRVDLLVWKKPCTKM